MNYGIPYQGSKSKIADQIVKIFPKADHFYDLFGGGFAITHAMLLHRSKDFRVFHFNEIRPGVPDLIKDAINGKYSYSNFVPKWISREEFFDKKEYDPYIKLIWSFGNNGRSYLFGKDIEAYKKSLHQAIMFNEFDDTAKKILGITEFKKTQSILDKRLFLKNRIKVLLSNKPDGEIRQLQRLERLERLQQLEGLQQLEQLERLQQLELYNGSYDEVIINKNSIIYCDIPYKNTTKYDDNKNFNRNRFFEWARAQTEPLFISEFDVEHKEFKCIWSEQVRSLMAGSKDKNRPIEKVYCNDIAYKLLLDKIRSGGK